MSADTVREQVVDAICKGLGEDQIESVELRAERHVVNQITIDMDMTYIHVKGHSEPIKVLPLDVILPPSLRDIAGLIMLDVFAILEDFKRDDK